MLEGPRTTLVVPVPEVASLVPDPAIALFDPFLPRHLVDEGVLRELTDLFAAVVPFTFVLGDAARFPSGGRYLPPQPTAGFRHLSHDVRREFSEVLPSTHSLEAAMPHLAVPEEVEVPGPVTAQARRAELRVGEQGREDVLAVFRFGTSAA